VRTLIGTIAILSAIVMGALTVLAIQSAGGLTPLAVISFVVVLLIGLAGIGALRADE